MIAMNKYSCGQKNLGNKAKPKVSALHTKKKSSVSDEKRRKKCNIVDKSSFFAMQNKYFIFFVSLKTTVRSRDGARIKLRTLDGRKFLDKKNITRERLN
jgi:hypothetical protein